MTREARALLAALCAAALLTAGLTGWRLIDSPLRYDEADFAAQAEGILTYGVPKVDFHCHPRRGFGHKPPASRAGARYDLADTNSSEVVAR